MFEISDDIRASAEEGFNDLIDQLGKVCRLYFPPIFVECTNCNFDPIGNKSSNVYKHGGPMPFHAMDCPMCNGQGKKPSENYVDITMTANVTAKPFSMAANVRYPDGLVETRGYIASLPQVLRCDYMICATLIEPYRRYRYKLYGEPIDPFSIVPGKYFVALWQRSG